MSVRCECDHLPEAHHGSTYACRICRGCVRYTPEARRPKLAQGGIVHGFDLPTVATVSDALRSVTAERDDLARKREAAYEALYIEEFDGDSCPDLETTIAYAIGRYRAVCESEAKAAAQIDQLRAERHMLRLAVAVARTARLDIERERDAACALSVELIRVLDEVEALVEKIPGRKPIDVLRSVIAAGQDARTGRDRANEALGEMEQENERLSFTVANVRRQRDAAEAANGALRAELASARQETTSVRTSRAAIQRENERLRAALLRRREQACPDPAAHTTTEGDAA